MILEEIGHGTLGAVHKGTWNSQVVAFKKLPIPADVEESDVVSHNQEIAALRLVCDYLNGMSQ